MLKILFAVLILPSFCIAGWFPTITTSWTKVIYDTCGTLFGACDCEYGNTICCSSYECVTPVRTPKITTITPTETVVVCSGGSRPDGNGDCY